VLGFLVAGLLLCVPGLTATATTETNYGLKQFRREISDRETSRYRAVVDGKTYYFVHLSSPVGPPNLYSQYRDAWGRGPNEVILDGSGLPVGDRSTARCVALVEYARRAVPTWGSADNLRQLQSLIRERMELHRFLTKYRAGLNLIGDATAAIIHAVITGGTSLAVDGLSLLEAPTEVAKVETLLVLTVAKDFDIATGAFGQAQAALTQDLTRYENALTYMEQLRRGMIAYAPAMAMLEELDGLDEIPTWWEEAAQSLLHMASEIVCFGAVDVKLGQRVFKLDANEALSFLDGIAENLELLAPLVTYTRYRADFVGEGNVIPPEAGNSGELGPYDEPPAVRYTLALAALFGHTQPLAAPQILNAYGQSHDGKPGIAITWAPVAGATHYEVYRDGALVYTTRGAGTTFWDMTGLIAGNFHTYRLRALGDGVSSELSPGKTVQAPAGSSTDNQGSIHITVDGNLLFLQQPPILRDRSTLVPLRAVAEALGALVCYDAATRSITLQLGDRHIELAIDDSLVLVNGAREYLSSPPIVVDDLTYVPVRFVAEAFGFSVDWDAAENAVSLTTPSAALGATRLLSATVKSDGETLGIEIVWFPVRDATRYIVQRDGRTLATVDASQTVYWDLGSLAAGNTYTYTVQAAYGPMLSPVSNALSCVAIPSAAQPTGDAALPAPEMLSAVPKPHGEVPGIEVDWTSVKGAVKYDLYRDGVLHTRSVESSFWDYDGLTPGQVYTYSVKAVGERGAVSELSNTKSCQAPKELLVLAAPELLSTLPKVHGEEPGIEVKWTSVSGACTYHVYRDDEFYASCSTNYYWDHGDLIPGVVYTYRIRAVGVAGEASPFSDSMSCEAPSTSRLDAPKSLTIVSRPHGDEPGLAIFWSTVSGAVAYEVFRDGVLHSQCATNEYWDHQGLIPGQVYRYQVRAVGSSGQVGPLSNAATYRVEPATSSNPAPRLLSATLVSDGSTLGIKLEWTAVSGARSYTVFRDGEFVAAVVSSITSVVDSWQLTQGTTYSYYVIAMYEDGPSEPSNTVFCSVP